MGKSCFVGADRPGVFLESVSIADELLFLEYNFKKQFL